MVGYICELLFVTITDLIMKKHLLTAFLAAVISAPWACGLNYLNLETMKVESGSLVPAPVRTVKNATVDGEEGVIKVLDSKQIIVK